MILTKVIMLVDEKILERKALHGESMMLGDLRAHGVETVIKRQSHEPDMEPEKAATEYDGMECGAAGTLYITDSDEMYRELRRQGKYVLPYRHEDNTEALFSGALYVIEQIEEADYEAVDLAYRRLAGLPWEILRTKRCIIRETTEADVDSFYAIYAQEEITRYMEDLYTDREQELAYVRDYREKVYSFYGYGMWTVLMRDGTVIGRAGISWREGFDLPELGFVIGVPWQRQGYAYEVCTAILDYAREALGFTQIQALVMAENEPSSALCRKLGFAHTGNAQVDGDRYVVWTYAG